jgi:hypothetical protein
MSIAAICFAICSLSIALPVRKGCQVAALRNAKNSRQSLRVFKKQSGRALRTQLNIFGEVDEPQPKEVDGLDS